MRHCCGNHCCQWLHKNEDELERYIQSGEKILINVHRRIQVQFFWRKIKLNCELTCCVCVRACVRACAFKCLSTSCTSMSSQAFSFLHHSSEHASPHPSVTDLQRHLWVLIVDACRRCFLFWHSCSWHLITNSHKHSGQRVKPPCVMQWQDAAHMATPLTPLSEALRLSDKQVWWSTAVP